jgi:hypothetical protein
VGANFIPKSHLSASPYIMSHCRGCRGADFHAQAGRIPPSGELRQPRFRGKTAAAISQKARLSS